jgi:hypothetical protein
MLRTTRCSMCSDFDVCEQCVSLGTLPPAAGAAGHDASHLLLRIDRSLDVVSAYPAVQNRAALRHGGVRCSQCGTFEFTGFRYQCQQCPNVDFCEACEQKGEHW